jgi:hypothetical protein
VKRDQQRKEEEESKIAMVDRTRMAIIRDYRKHCPLISYIPVDYVTNCAVLAISIQRLVEFGQLPAAAARTLDGMSYILAVNFCTCKKTVCNTKMHVSDEYNHRLTVRLANRKDDNLKKRQIIETGGIPPNRSRPMLIDRIDAVASNYINANTDYRMNMDLSVIRIDPMLYTMYFLERYVNEHTMVPIVFAGDVDTFVNAIVLEEEAVANKATRRNDRSSRKRSSNTRSKTKKGKKRKKNSQHNMSSPSLLPSVSTAVDEHWDRLAETTTTNFGEESKMSSLQYVAIRETVLRFLDGFTYERAKPSVLTILGRERVVFTQHNLPLSVTGSTRKPLLGWSVLIVVDHSIPFVFIARSVLPVYEDIAANTKLVPALDVTDDQFTSGRLCATDLVDLHLVRSMQTYDYDIAYVEAFENDVTGTECIECRDEIPNDMRMIECTGCRMVVVCEECYAYDDVELSKLHDCDALMARAAMCLSRPRLY